MAQAAEKIIEFPAGGIADFYMEDDEIEALGQLEAEEQFGNKGIANFSVVAERMASYGRHGDDTVAHVETGELVIPKALIEDNPKLRDSIFEHLEELGVEDPERYVVGSGANSINPDTGLPEFFFKKIARAVKKTVKKVSRAVKKVAKSVVKVVKKAAPIVLPFILTPLVGPLYAGALGAGIGTLIQGGDLKDAFKSALVGGAIGGATAAIGGGMQAVKTGGTFGSGAISGLKNAANLSNFSNLGAKFSAAYGSGSPTSASVEASQATSTGDLSPADIKAQATDVGQQKLIEGYNIPDKGQSIVDLQNQMAAPPPEGLTKANMQVVTGADGTLKLAPSSSSFDMSTAVDLPTKPPGFFESVKGAFTPGDDIGFLEGLGDAFLPSQNMTATELMKANPGMTTAQANQAIADASAGFARTYLPATAAGIGATAALGGFTPPEEPPQEELQTGADLIALNPDEYLLPEETPQYAQGPIQVGTDYGIDPRTGRPIVNPFRRPVYGRPVYAAEGGEIFPRRVGGIMPNEGTPGKDSVRAMLMPGEFVMTTDAVKGLGGGNNDRGINRMYDMMRGLEAKGRAMA